MCAPCSPCTPSQTVLLEAGPSDSDSTRMWRNSTLAMTLTLQTRYTASFLCLTYAPTAGKTELGLGGSSSPSTPGRYLFW